MKSDSEIYIERCLELAVNGSGYTAPNPMVGAVLVYNGKIIGEGYHHEFGGSHAEVNAIHHALENGNNDLLEKATLYVNLEPCNHTGKTPPCTELIIKHKILKVVIGSMDPNSDVKGNGIKKLIDSGVEVESGILEKECTELNRRFFIFHLKKRPFVLIKFAQTSDHFIAPVLGMNKKISNEMTDRLVHKWRSEESAIMVGTQTAMIDNPLLTVRKWIGKNPLRVVIDRNLQLPLNLRIFDNTAPTLVFNEHKNELLDFIEYEKIDFKENVISQILKSLYKRDILSVMVEGGQKLIYGFLAEGIWDEARIITSDKFFHEGVRAPEISGNIISVSKLTGDSIHTLVPKL